MGFLGRLLGWGGARGSLSSFGKSYKLVAREPVARNTHRFTFALESPEAVLGLPVGHHLEVRLPGGEGVSRAYTPVTGDRQRGSFDLVVKVYPRGRVSQYLDSLKVGDSAEVAGPRGEIAYRGGGAFEIESPFDGKRTVQCSGLGMIAGGTGITPMFQIAEHSASLDGDTLDMSLLFANRTPEEAMLCGELGALAAACPRLRVAYSVDEVRQPGRGTPAACLRRCSRRPWGGCRAVHSWSASAGRRASTRRSRPCSPASSGTPPTPCSSSERRAALPRPRWGHGHQCNMSHSIAV